MIFLRSLEIAELNDTARWVPELVGEQPSVVEIPCERSPIRRAAASVARTPGRVGEDAFADLSARQSGSRHDPEAKPPTTPSIPERRNFRSSVGADPLPEVRR
jgi:hypothetical protein